MHHGMFLNQERLWKLWSMTQIRVETLENPCGYLVDWAGSNFYLRSPKPSAPSPKGQDPLDGTGERERGPKAKQVPEHVT